jgi:hypothetical protein
VKIEPSRLNRVSLQEAQEVLAIFTQRFSNHKTVAQPGDFLLPALQIGQELTAVVAEELPDGRIVVNLGGTAIESDNPGGVGAGQILRLRVEHLEPQIVLHIIEQEESAAGEAAKLLRQHLPEVFGQRLSLATLQEQLGALKNFDNFASGAPWLTKLRSFISGLLQNEEPWSAERLLQFVQDSGLHYETKLFHALAKNPPSLSEAADTDLKGLLLGALKEFDSAAAAGEPRNAIAAQLTQLESQQAANLLAQLEGRAFQLQVPLFSGSAFSDVAISVQRDGRGTAHEGSDNRRGYQVLFLLELETLGRMKIDAHLQAQDLRVIFYVDHEENVARVRRELPGFQETLQALGYREVLLTARLFREMPQEQQLKFEALAFGIPPNVHLLNVKA